MKNIRLLCICFLFMILSSCTPTSNKSQLTTNILNCIDEVYTVYTLDDSVNLREYIVCDDYSAEDRGCARIASSIMEL